MGPCILIKVMWTRVQYCCSKALTKILLFIWTMASVQQNVFQKERSTYCLSGLTFVPNKYKCHWLPIKVICWLGINWDLKNNCMFIPPERISRIFFSRTGAFLQGSLLALPWEFSPNFLGDACKLMTKAMHHLIECRGGRCAYRAQILAGVIAEFESQPYCIRRKHTLPSWVVYCDASAVGCAASSPWTVGQFRTKNGMW